MKRRNYVDTSDWNCLLCHVPPEEDLDHLFFACPFSHQSWNDIGIQWHMNLHLTDRLLHANQTWRKGLFWEVFILAAWALWKVRNAKLFYRITPSRGAWRVYLRIELQLLVHRSTKESFRSKLSKLLQELNP